MIQTAKKQGRNELCDCGSGKKYKKCCGLPMAANVTLGDIMKCFYLLLQGASRENLAIPRGPIPFSKEMLAAVPDDLTNEILIAEKQGFLILTVKKRDEPLITVPTIKQIGQLGKKI